MGSPLAGAALTPGRAWALLHRSPEFLDPQELPEGVHHVVHVETPPKLSTLVVSRARALLAGGGDREDLVGHVECADAEGDILLSVWSADEQGQPASPPRLLVCCPESGTVDLVPSVPEQLGRLDSSRPLGIVRAAAPPGPRGGVHYLITQVQRADSSPPSSSPAAAHQRAGRADSSSPSSAAAPGAYQIALVFCSSSDSWTKKEVRPRRFDALSSEDEATWATVKEDEVAALHQRPPWFEPRAVLSHDSAGLLAFVDVEHRLLLLFNPVDDGVARFVQFPVSERELLGLEEEEVEAVAAADVGHCVAFSEGELCVLQVCPEGWITMWLLKDEEEDRWVKLFKVTSDEIYHCDTFVANCQGYVELGAVDPTDRCKLMFFMPEAETTLMVQVNPLKLFWSRVDFVEQVVDAGRNSWLDVVIWKYDGAAAVARGAAGSTAGCNRVWKLSRKGMGGMARRALRIARKYIHRMQPLAEIAGTTAEAMGVPFASKVAPTVAGLIKANQAACIGEEVMDWWKKSSQQDKKVKKVVGTVQEAEVVISAWKDTGKPMVVIPAPEVSQKELLQLRSLFRERGAEELLLSPPPDDEYYMVGTAAPYFPR